MATNVKLILFAMVILTFLETRSEAQQKGYWWEGDFTTPTTMWPANEGYCMLTEGNVGNSSTDTIRVWVENGTWFLGGSSLRGAATWAVGLCFPWPEGYDVYTFPWTGEGGVSLKSNGCFCNISGLQYSGSVGLATPQFDVYGYPSTDTSTMLTEFITNDSDPSQQVQATCMCPWYGPEFWEVYAYDGNGTQTMTDMTAYTGQTETWNASQPQMCGIQNIQIAQGGGPIDFSIENAIGSNSSWTVHMSLIGQPPLQPAKTTMECISYPGPIVQMNAGGSVFDSSTDPTFSADGNFSGGSDISTTNSINTSHLYRPAPAATYKDAHVGTSFSYTFSGYAPNSTHSINLHFAEIQKTGAGQRIFSATINNMQFVNNLDIFSQAGANTALMYQGFYPATASGQYVISFTGKVVNGVQQSALISAIEIQ